ncbi:MAG: VOC family protein [Hasllibacter sp.]
MADRNPAPIRALGEVAIRCADLAAMRAFYRDVVGLRELAERAEGGIVFFRIAPGHGGHTAVLALFDAALGAAPDGPAAPVTGAGSSLHHLALTVDRDAQDALRAFLDARGVPHRTEEFDWIGWRGVFVRDPEGNTVEFVAGPNGGP